MEYVDGPSLREIVDQHFEETISTNKDFVTEMIYYSIQVLGALEPTHKKGIIHRDIKPDNIMITSRGEVKITDFGIVHVEEATFTPTGAMLGTPRYMSPEQVSGAKIDGRSDIYSVGILMYEILTGSPPFITGDISYQQVNKDPVPPRAVNSVIPEDVNAFILKCLAKLPEDRHDTATDAKEALLKILANLGGCRKYQSSTVLGTRADLDEGSDPDATPVHEMYRNNAGEDVNLESPSGEPVEAPAGATPAQQPGFDPDLDLD
jgi:serine/threonine-protein kinase